MAGGQDIAAEVADSRAQRIGRSCLAARFLGRQVSEAASDGYFMPARRGVAKVRSQKAPVTALVWAQQLLVTGADRACPTTVATSRTVPDSADTLSRHAVRRTSLCDAPWRVGRAHGGDSQVLRHSQGIVTAQAACQPAARHRPTDGQATPPATSVRGTAPGEVLEIGAVEICRSLDGRAAAAGIR